MHQSFAEGDALRKYLQDESDKVRLLRADHSELVRTVNQLRVELSALQALVETLLP
jgi:hypothetical protein